MVRKGQATAITYKDPTGEKQTMYVQSFSPYPLTVSEKIAEARRWFEAEFTEAGYELISVRPPSHR